VWRIELLPQPRFPGVMLYARIRALPDQIEEATRRICRPAGLGRAFQWEFFFTCWKYTLEFWRGGTFQHYKYTIGVPLYYRMLARKLFGRGIKYPLYRFAGVPDRLTRRHLYLDFIGKPRDRRRLQPFEAEISPGLHTVRGLKMIDAWELHSLSALRARGDSVSLAQQARTPHC
jgi:hypothetical protein